MKALDDAACILGMAPIERTLAPPRNLECVADVPGGIHVLAAGDIGGLTGLANTLKSA